MLAKTKPSDHLVIRRVLGGRREDFAVLVERYLPTIHAIAYAHMHNHVDAEDVTQDTFLKAFQFLDTLRDTKKLEGWLVTIARNTCKGLWRSRRREAEAVAKSTPPEGVVTPDVEKEEMRELLRQKLDQLEEGPRETLVLHYFAGKSTREIARILSISRSASKKRLERARKTLSEDLFKEFRLALGPQRAAPRRVSAIMGAIASARVPWEGAVTASSGLTAMGASVMKGGVAMKVFAAAATATLIAGLTFWAGSPEQAVRPESDALSPDRGAVSESVPEPDVLLDELVAESPPGEEADKEPIEEQEEKGVTQKPPRQGSEKATETATPEQEEQGKRPKNAAIEKALNRSITISFETTHLDEVLEFMSEYLKINMVLDARVVAPARLERPDPTTIAAAEPEALIEYTTDGIVPYVKVEKVTVEQALEHVLYPLGLDFIVEPGFIWASTPELIRREVVREPDERYEAYDVEAVLQSLTTIWFEDKHVHEIVEFLSEYADVNIVLDYRVIQPPAEQPVGVPESHPVNERQRVRPAPPYVTDGNVMYVSLTRIALRDALKALLRPLSLAYSAEDGFIWISTGQKIRQEAFKKKDLSGVSPDVVKALAAQVSVDAEPAHISTVLSFLAQETGAAIVIDEQVASTPAARGKFTLNIGPLFKDLKLQSALQALLRQVNLDFCVANNVIAVGAPAVLRRRPVDLERFASATESCVKVHGCADTQTDSQDTLERSEEADFRLYAIVRVPDDGQRALLKTPSEAKWYDTGDTFDHYTVGEINAREQSCEITDNKTGRTLLIFQHQPDESTSSPNEQS